MQTLTLKFHNSIFFIKLHKRFHTMEVLFMKNTSILYSSQKISHNGGTFYEEYINSIFMWLVQKLMYIFVVKINLLLCFFLQHFCKEF